MTQSGAAFGAASLVVVEDTNQLRQYSIEKNRINTVTTKNSL